MSRPKNHTPKNAAPVDPTRPEAPARGNGPPSTGIVDDQLESPSQKTAAMPAFPVEGAPLTQPVPVWDESTPATLPTTQPTPAWEENVAPARATGLVTEPTPAWEDGASSKTRPLTAHPKAEVPTRAVLQPVAAASELDVGKVVTRPTDVPRHGKLPERLNLVLAALGSLSLVLMLWLFGRSDIVKDPSRPVPISKLPIAVPKERLAPPPKRLDVTPIIAAPKELPPPPLTMEVVLDAGAGQPLEKKSVPASIVRVETEPTSSISWNGEDFGWQPALITMPVGPNVITVENKELNLRKTFTITAAETEKTFLRFEFAKGWLSVDRPQNAKVSVEGLKVTQRAMLLWEGRHRVDCVFANGQKASKLVDVVRGETAELFFDDPLPQE